MTSSEALPKITDFYINGEFVPSTSEEFLPVVDPSTEKPVALVKMANQKDVDAAVRDRVVVVVVVVVVWRNPAHHMKKVHQKSERMIL